MDPSSSEMLLFIGSISASGRDNATALVVDIVG
jgi:hypothetical protein